MAGESAVVQSRLERNIKLRIGKPAVLQSDDLLRVVTAASSWHLTFAFLFLSTYVCSSRRAQRLTESPVVWVVAIACCTQC